VANCGGGWGAAGVDEKAKVTAADTTTDVLNNKITPGVGIATAVLNPGGNETLEISAPGSTTDERAKVTAADTTTDVLNNKIAVGVNMAKVILNPGGNEQLGLVSVDSKITVTGADTTEDVLNNKIVAGVGIATAVLNPGANETLQISAPGGALPAYWMETIRASTMKEEYAGQYEMSCCAPDKIAGMRFQWHDVNKDECWWTWQPKEWIDYSLENLLLRFHFIGSVNDSGKYHKFTLKARMFDYGDITTEAGLPYGAGVTYTFRGEPATSHTGYKSGGASRLSSFSFPVANINSNGGLTLGKNVMTHWRLYRERDFTDEGSSDLWLIEINKQYPTAWGNVSAWPTA